VFRLDRHPRFFESRWVRWGLLGVFALTTFGALFILWSNAREYPGRHLTFLLECLVFILALTGGALFLVYRAYSETRDRLTYVKVYAYDILQSISLGVLTCDLAGIITNVNGRATELAGIGRDGVERPLGDVLAQVPALIGPLNQLLRQGKEFSGMDVEVQVGNRQATLRLDGRFLLGETGERIGVILQIQDVTHLKFLDQEMRRTEKLAGLGTLAAGIAHEIKNPLAALSIHTQLLEESLPENAQGKLGKYLGVIRSEIRRLQGIVDKYVSFARPRSIERAPSSIESILEEVLALVEPECRKQRISIIREGFTPSPSRYLLDEGQIQQAMLNIVINAVQAMQKGGTLTCRLGRAGLYATVEIADSGPGIPKEARDRIFDLFYTTRQGGTGLGLYLTQRIVSDHKGYIKVDTGPTGTRFTIGLPVESQNEA
jgi:nitrogen-specific signal transduction histidine kinase